MTNAHAPRTMMGFDTFGDQKVPVAVRDWDALKLALYRSRGGWAIAMRAAEEILERCEHLDSCPARRDESAQCVAATYTYVSQGKDPEGNEKVTGVLDKPGCRDREQRMSALVILNAGRLLAPENAKLGASVLYSAPSREHFSDILAELAATHAELVALRAALRARGVAPPTREDLLLSSPTTPQLEAAKEVSP